MSETKTVLELIAAERQRQIAKGWTPEHDDNEHGDGWLAKTAGYACVLNKMDNCPNPTVRAILNHPDRTQQLVIAAAMIVAEIERIQRSVKSNSPVIPDGSNL